MRQPAGQSVVAGVANVVWPFRVEYQQPELHIAAVGPLVVLYKQTDWPKTAAAVEGLDVIKSRYYLRPLLRDKLLFKSPDGTGC